MDREAISEGLYYYTSGYPFLVSGLCKIIDEELIPTKETKGMGTWTILIRRLKRIHQEKNTNFDSLIKNLENNPELFGFGIRDHHRRRGKKL